MINKVMESTTLTTYVQSGWEDSNGGTSPWDPQFAPIFDLPWSAWLVQWFEYGKGDLPKAWQGYPDYELTLRLTHNEEIQSLNSNYREINRPTDVLAFASLDDPTLSPLEPWDPAILAEDPLYLGDIVISLPTALTQAQQQGHDLQLEVIWLASHGFLHLLGWDHPDNESLQRMLNQQGLLLEQTQIVLPHPFWSDPLD